MCPLASAPLSDWASHEVFNTAGELGVPGINSDAHGSEHCMSPRKTLS